jgi:hypothetical protein
VLGWLRTATTPAAVSAAVVAASCVIRIRTTHLPTNAAHYYDKATRLELCQHHNAGSSHNRE